MATPISQLKGTATEVAAKIYGNAVLVWNETAKRWHGGDGITPGGIPMAREDQKNDGSFGYLQEIKADNYAVVAGDIGKILLANKATALSFTLAAAATLGSKFTIAIKNIGGGTLSIVPNGTELINGANAAYTVPSGASTVLKCDGAAFRTVLDTPGITGEGMDPWALQPIGVEIAANAGMSIFTAPPKDKSYRYIQLSAGASGAGGYNEGALTTESVSGSSPTIVATAVISLAGSPLLGATVRLINTTREFLRPGSPGTQEASQNLSHAHGVTDPGHSHNIGYQAGPPGNVYSGGQIAGVASLVGPVAFTSGASGSNISIQANGGTEARSRNIGRDFYMRIK